MLHKEKPAPDLLAAVNRIEEQATEIERKKAEIARLEKMVDEYEKKMEQLLSYEGKSDELSQENEALKRENQTLQRKFSALSASVEERLKPLENLGAGVSQIDAAALCNKVSALDESLEKAGNAVVKVPVYLFIHWIAVIVVIGAFVGGMYMTYQKIGAVGGHVLGVQQTLEDNGIKPKHKQ